jgi:hypothetical protein
VNRREYLGAALGVLGAACSDSPGGAGPGAAVPASAAAGPAGGTEGLGIVVVTDFADRVRGAGTADEDWGRAFEAAWNAAAETGTDVFVPAGRYPVRLREGPGGYGPALDLVQSGKYRPVRLLGGGRGAVLHLAQWPAGAPRSLEVVRVRTGVRAAAGGADVATGAAIANLTLENRDPRLRSPGWRTPHDYAGVGIRLLGLYGASVTNCLIQGFETGIVLGQDGGDEASYVCDVSGNRFQYRNRAVRLPPTANGHSVRGNLLLWLNQPRSGPAAAFEASHSITSTFFSENSAEKCGVWIYGIGAAWNTRITGGRMESVAGVARVHGTGDFPARGTEIRGLSVDCDFLRSPAIWLERSAGAVVSGIVFYQSRNAHPHVRVGTGALRTSLSALESADAPLRVEGSSAAIRWTGWGPPP